MSTDGPFYVLMKMSPTGGKSMDAIVYASPASAQAAVEVIHRRHGETYSVYELPDCPGGTVAHPPPLTAEQLDALLSESGALRRKEAKR